MSALDYLVSTVYNTVPKKYFSKCLTVIADTVGSTI